MGFHTIKGEAADAPDLWRLLLYEKYYPSSPQSIYSWDTQTDPDNCTSERRQGYMSEKEMSTLAGSKSALVLDQKDNVAVALSDLAAGDSCLVTEDGGKKYEVAVTEKIPFGHKFALTDLAPHAPVYKYGEEIGRMKVAIARGGWIHNHNMYCDRGMK